MFRRYHTDGDQGAHTTTSVSVANAIVRLDTTPYDRSMWWSIFQQTFNKSVTEQLEDSRGMIWTVDARWAKPVGSRFTSVDRGNRGRIRSWELN